MSAKFRNQHRRVFIKKHKLVSKRLESPVFDEKSGGRKVRDSVSDGHEIRVVRREFQRLYTRLNRMNDRTSSRRNISVGRWSFEATPSTSEATVILAGIPVLFQCWKGGSVLIEEDYGANLLTTYPDSECPINEFDDPNLSIYKKIVGVKKGRLRDVPKRAGVLGIMALVLHKLLTKNQQRKLKD